MKFGPIPVKDAHGAILAHSVALTKGRLRKGVVLEPEHLEQLAASGVDEVVVARLEAGDVNENDAAERLANALVPLPNQAGLDLTAPFTGRVNINAATAGVARIDIPRLVAANRVNPMITVATVPDMQQMKATGMVATVKIISYAVPEQDLAIACDLAKGAISLARPVLRSASLFITRIDGGPGDKGADAISARLDALGMTLAKQEMVEHQSGALAEAIANAPGDLVLILTGSATSDSHDVAPEAVRRAGGRVDRFGMPVDPGNLLFIGSLADGRPVIGLPGCARSPALNGADWVLSRITCGINVTADDIAGMGVGGLLKEIPTRPMPRRGK